MSLWADTCAAAQGYSARTRARPATCPSRTPGANSPPSRTRFSIASTSTPKSSITGRERCRRLQPGDHLAERAQEGRLAAGERRQRTFDHEVHQHHARLFVGVVHGRRDAGLLPRRADTDSCAAGFGSPPGRPRAAAGTRPSQRRSAASTRPTRRRSVGLIPVTDAGSATDAIAASAAARRSSAIAENTSAIRRPCGTRRRATTSSLPRQCGGDVPCPRPQRAGQLPLTLVLMCPSLTDHLVTSQAIGLGLVLRVVDAVPHQLDHGGEVVDGHDVSPVARPWHLSGVSCARRSSVWSDAAAGAKAHARLGGRCVVFAAKNARLVGRQVRRPTPFTSRRRS